MSLYEIDSLLKNNIYFLVWFYILFLFFTRKYFSQIIFWYWVPFVETSDEKLEIFLRNLNLKKWQKIIDLWSGNWKVLEAIEKKYIDKFGNSNWLELFGVENSIYPYRESLEKKQKNNLHYTIYKWDFFKIDLSKYDVIYTYMLPYLLKKIWKKIKKECKSWTLFYSNTFKIFWEKEFQKLHIDKEIYIYIYKV